MKPSEANFRRALDVTLAFEGGLVDDPVDRGGRTYRGVTERTWRAWLKARGRIRRAGKLRDVAAATPNKVRAIYREGYWLPAHCDEMAGPLFLAHFDAAVHHGPARAVKLLQACLGVPTDGVFGPMTRGKMLMKDKTSLTLAVIAARNSFLRAIALHDPSQQRFLRGWLNRTEQLTSIVNDYKRKEVNP